MTVLLWLNVLMAATSVAFAVIALTRPTVLMGTVGPMTESGRFYAWMYAFRAIPLGVAVAVVVLANLGTPSDTRWWLLVAGIAQAGDAALGERHRLWGMAGGASAAAIVHLTTALIV